MLASKTSSLWADTPEDALRCAVQAQPRHSVWHCLLQAAVTPGDASSSLSVVAGIVLSIASAPRRYLCVSLGSGTRCGGAHVEYADTLLHTVLLGDGHAEVVARRGFVAFLLEASERLLDRTAVETNPFLTVRETPSERSLVQWVPGVEAHLVVTKWPCGFLARCGAGESGGRLLLRTPCASLRRQGAQRLEETVEVFQHVLAAHKSAADTAEESAIASRVKPGKGPANLHMSCSDKVWRWATTGLCGSRRRFVLPELRLASLHTASACHAASEESRSIVPARGTHEMALRVLCFPFETLQMPPVAGASESTGKRADSSYSRANWLRNIAADGEPSRLQRVRIETNKEVFPHSCSFGWSGVDVVVNTKSGLPQGVTESSIQRLYPELYAAASKKPEEVPLLAALPSDSMLFKTRARGFPLSRAWMFFKVADLLSAHSINSKPLHEPSLSSRYAVKMCHHNVSSDGTLDTAFPILWTLKPRRGDTVPLQSDYSS